MRTKGNATKVYRLIAKGELTIDDLKKWRDEDLLRHARRIYREEKRRDR